MAVVMYDGEEIPLAAGKTTVFNCTEKDFKSDIMVRAGAEKVNIIYNNLALATVESGQTLALKCKDFRGRGTLQFAVDGEGAYELSGTWLLDADDPFELNDFHEECNFSSGGRTFSSITLKYDHTEDTDYFYHYLYYGDLFVATIVFDMDVGYSETTWQNEAYRTITFDGTQEVSENLHYQITTYAEKIE